MSKGSQDVACSTVQISPPSFACLSNAQLPTYVGHLVRHAGSQSLRTSNSGKSAGSNEMYWPGGSVYGGRIVCGCLFLPVDDNGGGPECTLSHCLELGRKPSMHDARPARGCQPSASLPNARTYAHALWTDNLPANIYLPAQKHMMHCYKKL